MNRKNLIRIHSQLDLPFQETKHLYLKEIFKTLERRFDLQKDSNQFFIDLGSGNGQVVIYCAINYGLKSFGIEINLTLVEEAKKSIKLLKKLEKDKKKRLRKIKIIGGDFYKLNLGNYDFVYIYSLPTMQKYLRHVFQTIKNGAIIISHTYPFRNFKKCLDLKFKLEYGGENHGTTTFFYIKI
ncbi:MAG: methyltransferase domain-containing protein [Promethearchaeota archaeon]|jgi:SAM-dependent methyltransferase